MQGGKWQSVHIDEIQMEKSGMPSVLALKDRSVCSLFEAGINPHAATEPARSPGWPAGGAHAGAQVRTQVAPEVVAALEEMDTEDADPLVPSFDPVEPMEENEDNEMELENGQAMDVDSQEQVI